MPRVLITGAAGKIGRASVRELVAAGWDVVAFDRAPAEWGPDVAPEAVTFVPMDLTDYAQVLDATLGLEYRYERIDALVHLAAIPAPSRVGDHQTFANNMTVTHNVISAARRAGIKNIVWASSETVLGLPFDTPPPYLPVDELYPPRPETTYSLVKTLEEQMAAQLCRWDPELTMIGLRFSNVMELRDYDRFPSFHAELRLRKRNLWSYIDARDAAQAVRLALAYGRPGLELFIIANADTVMTRPNSELIAEFFPDVEIRGRLGEHDTLESIDKARAVLGFEPRHGWRTN